MEAFTTLDVILYVETISLLICGLLSCLMLAGFALQESGMVRSHNSAASCFKILMVFALGGLAYFIIGYELMYIDNECYSWSECWSQIVWAYPTLNPDILINIIAAGMIGAIISGVLAERVKIIPLLIFSVIICGLIYPLQGAWIWNNGWPHELTRYIDFGGASLHMIGGWCALTGALILGPRLGKFSSDGRIRAFQGSNIPIAMLGTVLICIGWMGFIASKSMPAYTNNIHVIYLLQMSLINATLAAFAGCAGSALFAKLRYGKPDITLVLNGTLAGLIAVSASANQVEHVHAMIIGGFGGVLCAMSVNIFDRLKIDDVTGGLSVHLIAGIWGILAVGIFVTGEYFIRSLIGILIIAAFSLSTSSLIWLALKKICGLRLTEKDESIGSDRAEIGIKAYPDFEVTSAG